MWTAQSSVTPEKLSDLLRNVAITKELVADGGLHIDLDARGTFLQAQQIGSLADNPGKNWGPKKMK